MNCIAVNSICGFLEPRDFLYKIIHVRSQPQEKIGLFYNGAETVENSTQLLV